MNYLITDWKFFLVMNEEDLQFQLIQAIYSVRKWYHWTLDYIQPRDDLNSLWKVLNDENVQKLRKQPRGSLYMMSNKDMYDREKTSMRMVERDSKNFFVLIGLHLGLTLSVFLFALFS